MQQRALGGQVVLITGATSGIGAACARMLANAGACVICGGRRRDRLEKLVSDVGDAHAVAVPMDVRKPTDARNLVALGLERFGRIDSLVLSAGIGAYGSILDYSDDALAEMIDTNIAGTIWPIRSALPPMLEGGAGGDIVIIGSVAGLRGAGNEAVYAATKFAQVGLAGALDRELTPQGIRVTVIGPAATRTEFAMGSGRSPDMPGLADMMDADDVASAVVTVLQQPRRLRTQLWSMWSMAETS